VVPNEDRITVAVPGESKPTVLVPKEDRITTMVRTVGTTVPDYIKFEPLLLFYCVCTTVIFLWILLYHRKQFTCDLDNILLFSINTEVDVPSSGTNNKGSNFM
jgi:hypothetical protein